MQKRTAGTSRRCRDRKRYSRRRQTKMERVKGWRWKVKKQKGHWCLRIATVIGRDEGTIMIGRRRGWAKRGEVFGFAMGRLLTNGKLKSDVT